MNEYADFIKGNLDTVLTKMQENSWLFVNEPKKDFTRNPKLNFKEMMNILLSIGGNNLNIELIKYFSYDPNLAKEGFSIEKIKEIYHMRWGIETSFRELKYAIGLTNFHSKKADYIIQEIFARLTIYNFCEIITTHVVIQQKSKKYGYQVNFTIAISIYMHYFRCRNVVLSPNVKVLIKRNILPVRNGRKDPRKVRTKSAVSFIYRVA